ncbi:MULTISPECIES: hypothetical protein [Methylobacter]
MSTTVMDAGGRAIQEQLPRSGSFSGNPPCKPETPPCGTRLDGLIPAYAYRGE